MTDDVSNPSGSVAPCIGRCTNPTLHRFSIDRFETSGDAFEKIECNRPGYLGNTCIGQWLNLEARVGIEPTHKGFADLSLTAWVPRHLEQLYRPAGQNPVWHLRLSDHSSSLRNDFSLESLRESGYFSPAAPEKSQVAPKVAIWSGRRDLNPRPSPWQGDALPLSYSRIRPEAVYRAAHRPVNAAPYAPSVR